jgi:hypothetical protein
MVIKCHAMDERHFAGGTIDQLYGVAVLVV